MVDRSKDYSSYGGAPPGGLSHTNAAAAWAAAGYGGGHHPHHAMGVYGMQHHAAAAAAGAPNTTTAASSTAALQQHYVQQFQNLSKFAAAAQQQQQQQNPFNVSGGHSYGGGGGGGATAAQSSAQQAPDKQQQQQQHLFGFPPGHPMHFPGLSNYHRPLPAHSPLPAHLSSNNSPSASPLPAHMRSNPYQPTTNYHALNAPPPNAASAAAASYASYLQPGGGNGYNHKGNNGEVNKDSLSNGHHVQQANRNPYNQVQHQPQHYGNPKEFASLSSREAQQQSKDPKPVPSSSHPLGYQAYQPQHPPQQQQQPPTMSSQQASSYAAQLMNTFSGAANQLAPSLIGHHHDASRTPYGNNYHVPSAAAPAAAAAATQQRPNPAPVGLNLSNPPSPAPADVHGKSSMVHQPRGPTIDARSGDKPPAALAAANNGNATLDLSQMQSLPSESKAPATTPSRTILNTPSVPQPKAPKTKPPIKRKCSMEDTSKSKKVKENNNVQRSAASNLSRANSGDDPYSFEEDEEKEASNHSVDFARFGGPPGGRKQPVSGPVYKFKNALLSRENRTSSTESRSSVGSSKAGGAGLVLDKRMDVFVDVCDRMEDELRTKVIAISRKPDMAAYRKRLQERKEKNANRGRKRKSLENSSELETSGVVTENETSVVEATTEPVTPAATPEKKDCDSANSTPKKKSPGRKKKVKEQESKAETNDEETKTEEQSKEEEKDEQQNGQHKEQNGKEESKPKKGGLWALPIVPKLPKLPHKLEKKKSPAPTPVAAGKVKAKDVPVADIWLKAFGGVKTKKPAEPVKSLAVVSKVKKETEEECSKKKFNYFDVPPEVRRRTRPPFGGLIHFAPDWEQKVRSHHSNCRLPQKLTRGILVKPRILTSDLITPGKSAVKEKFEAPHISPQDRLTLQRRNDELSPPRLQIEMSPPSSSLSTGVNEEIPMNERSVVDKILEKRKQRAKMGRMYKLPFQKEKKKMRIAYDKLPEDGSVGLLPTPGLPLLTQDTTDVLMGTNFGNFRRQTLLRYLDSLDDSAELKAKILDWKPEVLETKTRRQSNQIKVSTNYKEIFGIDLPTLRTEKEFLTPTKKKKEAKKAQATPVEESPKTDKEEDEEVVEEKKKKKVEEKKIEEKKATPKKTPKVKKPKEPKAKEAKESKEPVAADVSDKPSTSKSDTPVKVEVEEEEEEREPTEEELKLQDHLQGYALDLLDDNLSWSNRTVIQNLVIWEPVGDPVLLPPEKRAPKKKPKKHKKRQSGLDFGSSGKKKNKSSRDVSRASSLERDEPKEVFPVRYSLDNVINESKGWVIDKGAGETILHRASKMGYPDVVAYAVDILKMPANLKDNAGIPPIHKAAYKGHADIVEILLKYGVDPNTNVKGTRPLHEALDCGNADAVHRLLQHGSDILLYDYSGNMPIDLTEGDDELRRYLTGLLADLHGKEGERWNVSHAPEYYLPPSLKKEEESSSGKEEEEEDDDDDFLFEVSSHPLPAHFKFPDRQGQYVLASELRGKLDPKKCTVVSVPREEFLKSAHCLLLGYSKPAAVAAGQESVELVLVDNVVRKQMGVEGLPPSSSSPVKSSPRSPSKASPMSPPPSRAAKSSPKSSPSTKGKRRS